MIVDGFVLFLETVELCNLARASLKTLGFLQLTLVLFHSSLQLAIEGLTCNLLLDAYQMCMLDHW
jgi:hypothetical protein